MRITSCLALVLMLGLFASGCESDSPTAPDSTGDAGSGMSDGGSSGGVSDDGGDTGASTGPPLSSTTATVDGVPYTATEILAPDPDILEDIAGTLPPLLDVATGERSTGWAFGFSAPLEVGTHRTPTIGVQAALTKLPPYGPGELDPDRPISNIAQWIAIPPLGGSGSVTISTLTETTATGTFSFNLVPSPGPSTATGTKRVVGSFDLTFTDEVEIQF